MRPQNLKLDLSSLALASSSSYPAYTQQPTEVTMSTSAPRAKLPLSRSQTDPLKRLAFVSAEVIPSYTSYDSQPSSHHHHRSSMDTSEDDDEDNPCTRQMSGPSYSHAIDKPTSTYAESLARRSRANTTNNTPSHSPSRLSRTRCPNCGVYKEMVLPPVTSNPAPSSDSRAISPPRSKHFQQQIRNGLSTILCEQCTAAERARLTFASSSAMSGLAGAAGYGGGVGVLEDEGQLFVPMDAAVFAMDENRLGRRRRRRASSSVNGAGDR